MNCISKWHTKATAAQLNYFGCEAFPNTTTTE
jgi:hypothetical protein